MIIIKGVKNENSAKKVLNELKIPFMNTDEYKRRRSCIEVKDYVISLLEKDSKIDRKIFLMKCRKKEFVYIRHMARKLIKDHTFFSLETIGHYTTYGTYGDHATVLHSIKESDKLYETDINYRKKFDELSEKIINYKVYTERILDPISLTLLNLLKNVETNIEDSNSRTIICEMIEDLLLEIDEK